MVDMRTSLGDPSYGEYFLVTTLVPRSLFGFWFPHPMARYGNLMQASKAKTLSADH